ncbi:HAL/PAL/TAL family ammonia-lyase [Gluconobacter wancherniae]|uniref:Histidine ammonia-lyase n=1 Tax=Gluconobacter wancherniae NBRC 103581 TaxID=656744 RepID=A0A511AZK4_9PROT|nr:histidine ammonia-lyase [Gluconobacter wancherniae]MBF0853779.1 histidine ammonia-lyase [Gluconobacter wancherniae]GBD55469.1 phenylalanine/histidine ammonia-lyase [Gluconobacter wancherniae NBRC 103581]GBR66717.1 histidine ammonia-lyase [Gluconobacter wancherniae NBRC 103581]GEK93630.1 histidine ammonia-lyase [Gluconobacter wancherniae NBRC 103581]
MTELLLDQPFSPQDICDIARNRKTVRLSQAARKRLEDANRRLRVLVESEGAAYGLNTGVGGLSDTRITPEKQSTLSRKILFSHATGLGAPLSTEATRAIIACAVNQYCLGYSGLRAEIVDRLVALLNHDCLPIVPSDGSVGYLTHMAHISLTLIGHGTLRTNGTEHPAAKVLERLGFPPLVLEAKEGLCLVNGLSCASGIASLVTEEAATCLHWADRIAAATFDVLGGQQRAFDPRLANLRIPPGHRAVSQALNQNLAGSTRIADARGQRTQDALSLRAIPHIHGSVHDALTGIRHTVTQELQSLSDNPAIIEDETGIGAFSEAHAVGASIARVMDEAAIALASLGAVSERRLDRMVNPLLSPLPAFLSSDSGTGSGFMIAQYTAASLVSANRRNALPASLDGGITSGLQEDILVHATPAALKARDVVANTRSILAIELLALCQAVDLAGLTGEISPRTLELYNSVRAILPLYEEDHPLADDITRLEVLMQADPPCRTPGSP